MTVPIKSWAKDLEDGAMKQAVAVSGLPFVFDHVAIMPDGHQGYGVPIGCVLATKGVVIPSAVGSDIGCGVRLITTDYEGEISRDTLTLICDEIRRRVPTGYNKHPDEVAETKEIPEPPCDAMICDPSLKRIAHSSMGTLGGGNHFIELQRNSKGYLCFMIHSGSRNLGKQICDMYNRIAVEQNAKWFSSVDPVLNLAFLPVLSEYGEKYIRSMYYSVSYAKHNRRDIAIQVLESIQKYFPALEIAVQGDLDCCHNYVELEQHMGLGVLVHRKGAIRAFDGDLGIIPGSQGTCSYVTLGRGERTSFMSSSHGAGRRMGRKQAQRELNLADEIERMDKAGIVHDMKSVDDLDEAVGAYKDIDEVMEAQEDLCTIVDKLTPIAVVKG